MKIGVYWKKYNNVNIPEIKEFYLFVHEYLRYRGIDFDIMEQSPLHDNGVVNRASHDIDLPANFPVYSKINRNKANMPFKVERKSGGYDYEFYFHTISSIPNIVNIKPFYLAEYFYFDRCGYSGWSEIAQLNENDLQSSAEGFNEIARPYICENRSKYLQPTGGKLPKSFVFLPAQVHNDSVSNWARIPIYELISAAAEVIPKMGLNLVIKRS